MYSIFNTELGFPFSHKRLYFSDFINPVFQEQDHQIKVWVTVKYLDEMTKATQLSQYELTLEKKHKVDDC